MHERKVFSGFGEHPFGWIIVSSHSSASHGIFWYVFPRKTTRTREGQAGGKQIDYRDGKFVVDGKWEDSRAGERETLVCPQPQE